MRSLTAILFIVSLFWRCTSSKKEDVIYFGGEIRNPKSKYVVLLQNDKAIDTLYLDKNHRFFKKFNHLKENLYTFKHNNEFQYVYLQPNDSVLVHLNTWDFDESLVFSGKGSYKNEFLLDLFLDEETILPKINPYFSKEEIIFDAQIDSLTKKRLRIYHQFLENKTPVSDKFKNLASIAIHYPIYRLKEVYPLYYHNTHHRYPKISKEYYAFRKKVDLNIPSLISFQSYYTYPIGYIYNIGYLKSQLHPEIPLNRHFLNTIIENISSETLKNDLLYRFIITNLFDNSPYCASDKKALDLFFNNCTNKKSINKLQKLIDDCKKLPLQQPLTNFAIENYRNQFLSIKSIINNQNSIIYFWSNNIYSPEYLVNRIHFLKNRFPNILFIGINMNPDFDMYASDKGYLKLKIKNQFKLPKNSKAFQFLTSEYPRVIMVDKSGKIIHHFLSLNSTNLNYELQLFENN